MTHVCLRRGASVVAEGTAFPFGWDRHITLQNPETEIETLQGYLRVLRWGYGGERQCLPWALSQAAMRAMGLATREMERAGPERAGWAGRGREEGEEREEKQEDGGRRGENQAMGPKACL